MDGRLRQFAASFRAGCSTPQRSYFEIVLLAVLLGQEAKTLTGLLRHYARDPLGHRRVQVDG